MEVKKLIEIPVKNTGLVVEEPKPENYHATNLFGAVGEGFVGTDSPLDEPPIIFPTGKGWLQVARDYGTSEKQYLGAFDSYHCVIYTIAKALCYYLFKVHGIKITISEMYNGFFAGVQPNRGTTIEKGMESFRKHGWISDEKYPFNPEQFFKEPPKNIQIEAEGVLTEWDLHWEVLPKNLKAIFEAYKRTPAVLIGFAWASYYGEGVFFDNGNPSNHAFLGLEPKDNGNNIIDDTYPRDREDNDLIKDDMLKELHSSFAYGGAWRVWLTPTEKKKTSLLILSNKSMKNFYYYWDDKGHHFFYIGVPAGETKKYRQEIKLEDGDTKMNFLYIGLRESMTKSSCVEVSKYPDINLINKKFA